MKKIFNQAVGMAAGLGMKSMPGGEERREFHPEYTPSWADHDPLLKHPNEYGLTGFREQDFRLNSGEHVTAWYKPATEGFPTIVYCHGNSGSLDMRRDQLKELTDRGFGVMIAAYPGFKGHVERSSLITPSEEACVSTCRSMIRDLVFRRRVPLEKIVLLGESMGGGVAIQAAHDVEQPHNFLGSEEPEKVGAVITLNTFSSLVRKAEEVVGIPVGPCMQNRFESDKYIKGLKTRVLLLHGDADTYIPPAHSERLQGASEGHARLQMIPGCNHDFTLAGSDFTSREHVIMAIDMAQQFLSETGMCPPPPKHGGVGGNGADGADEKWQTAVGPVAERGVSPYQG